MVLGDIYQYVLDNFPYFRWRGQGWRNSVRHNLSLNDFFIKSGRAANGKGNYWTVHPACISDFQKGDFRRRRAASKVRKYMGIHQEEDEDEESSQESPIPSPLHLNSYTDTSDSHLDEDLGFTDEFEKTKSSKSKILNFGMDFLLRKS